MVSTSLGSARKWGLIFLEVSAGKPPVFTATNRPTVATPSAPATTVTTTSSLTWVLVSGTTFGAMFSCAQKPTSITSSTTATASPQATSSASVPQSDTLSVQTKLGLQPRAKSVSPGGQSAIR